MRFIAFLLTVPLASSLLWSTPSMAVGPVTTCLAASAPHRPEKLLQCLRDGGYTVYFRHGVTDPTQDDVPGSSDLDCAHQRNLSTAGREQARVIGAAIDSLGLRLGTVVAGPLCRTMDTARLMFGHVQADGNVRGGGLGRTDYPGLRGLLSAPVPRGTIRVIVGHGHQFRLVAASNESELAEGEAAVIKGWGDGRFEIVARLRRQEWEALAVIASRPTLRSGRVAAPNRTVSFS